MTRQLGHPPIVDNTPSMEEQFGIPAMPIEELLERLDDQSRRYQSVILTLPEWADIRARLHPTPTAADTGLVERLNEWLANEFLPDTIPHTASIMRDAVAALSAAEQREAAAQEENDRRVAHFMEREAAARADATLMADQRDEAECSLAAAREQIAALERTLEEHRSKCFGCITPVEHGEALSSALAQIAALERHIKELELLNRSKIVSYREGTNDGQ